MAAPWRLFRHVDWESQKVKAQATRRRLLKLSQRGRSLAT
jgi:hypothetical protein